MAIQYSTTLRNNQLDQIESTVGVSGRLYIYSGAVPVSCAMAASGLLLMDIELPSDWMAASSGGVKNLSGTWAGFGTVAAGSGTNAGYFRVMNAAGSVCHAQGTITLTAGGGDMTLDNVNIAQGQAVVVNSFAVTAGNA